MRLWDRLRGWASSTEQEKVAMDRRAFLRGMTVTAGGLLVPGLAVFDLGRRQPRELKSLKWDFEIEEQVVYQELPESISGEIVFQPAPDFQLISVDFVKDPVNPSCRFVEPVGLTDEAFQRQFGESLEKLSRLWESSDGRRMS